MGTDSRGFLLLALSLLLFSLLISARLTSAASLAHGEMITLAADANLRKGPGPQFEVITSLRKGARLRVVYQVAEWTRVELAAGGQDGWVHLLLLDDEAPALAPQAEPPLLAPSARKKGLVPASTPLAPKQQPSQLIAVFDLQQVITLSKRGRTARQRFEELRAAKTADLAQAEEELIRAVIMEIRVVVEEYARDHGYSHVINSNSGSLFFYDTSFDITRQIIDSYDRQPAPDHSQP